MGTICNILPYTSTCLGVGKVWLLQTRYKCLITPTPTQLPTATNAIRTRQVNYCHIIFHGVGSIFLCWFLLAEVDPVYYWYNPPGHWIWFSFFYPWNHFVPASRPLRTHVCANMCMCKSLHRSNRFHGFEWLLTPWIILLIKPSITFGLFQSTGLFSSWHRCQHCSSSCTSCCLFVTSKRKNEAGATINCANRDLIAHLHSICMNISPD